MSCPTCTNSNGPIIVGGLSSILATINTPCTTSLCPSSQDSKCTFYTAANLPCSGINSQDSIEVALQKIDTQLCASAANYSSYNTSCITPHATQQQWVEAISLYACNTNTALTTFTGTTFPTYQTTIVASLLALQIPGTTSSCTSKLNIANTDSLQSVLQKLSNATCDIYTNQLSLSGINWNQCFTVSPTPTTIADGFAALASQICNIQSGGGAPLPTFNNVGSCLPTPVTTSDTLVATVNKIKTLICQTPTFDINALTWNCVSKPSTTTTDLQAAFQSLLSQIDILSKGLPTFSGDFSVTATDPSHPCAGKTIGLSTSIVDRFVAATSTDNTPGTLQSKLVEGTNITFDYTDPTHVTINATSSGGASDGKVLTDSADSTKDYLFAKMEVGAENSGLSISPVLDTTSGYHRISQTINVDPVALFTALLNAVSTDTALQSLLCSINNACPSPCAAPTNISVVYGGTTSSTTTTTTTSAPTTSSTTTTTTTGTPTTTTTTTSTSTSSTTTTTTTHAPTTTTTTTSTTTSSTTTTTTTLDTIFVGAQSSGTPPVASVILAGNVTSQDGSANVVADWTPFNGTPQYTWVAIPNKGGTYTKNTWFQSVVNNGSIGGGGSTFATPTTVIVSGNSYLVYITNFATQWTGTVLMEH